MLVYKNERCGKSSSFRYLNFEQTRSLGKNPHLAESSIMWQSMTQQELQFQYSPSRWVKRMDPDSVLDAHENFYKITCEKVRSEVQNESNIPYGPSEAEKLDIFAPEHLPKDAPVFIYFHGGYWQALSRDISCYMAGTFTKAGAVVIVVGYELAPKASVAEIVTQCNRAVQFVLQWAANRGSRGVYMCGHSAGGHISAMMLTFDYKSLVGETAAKLLKGIIPVGGVFDLRPIVYIIDNEPLKLTLETAWNSSPMKYIEAICERAKENNMEILAATCDNEPTEYQRQSKEFIQALKENEVNASVLQVADVDHFNMVENISDENYVLTKEIFRVMKLSK